MDSIISSTTQHRVPSAAVATGVGYVRNFETVRSVRSVRSLARSVTRPLPSLA